MPLLPLEIIIVANAILLLLAGLATLFLIRLSVIYRRNVGDDSVQYRQMRVIISVMLLLFFIGLAAAALNLFAA